MHVRVQLAISTLFSLGYPAQGIVLLTINMGLLTSINIIQIIPQRHARGSSPVTR